MMATKTDAKRLEEIRDAIAKLADEAADLERRPVSRDEAVAALDHWIALQASNFDPVITNLINKGEAWTQLGEVRPGGALDFTSALCALAGDRVREDLIGRIDAALADAAPMGAEERNTRRQEIDREKLTLEREEETIVQRFRDAGQHVERRGDADPRAVLGLNAAPKRPALPAEVEERAPIAHGPSKLSRGDVI